MRVSEKIARLILILSVCMMVSCNSSSDDSDSDGEKNDAVSDNEVISLSWSTYDVGSITGGGMLIPNIKAAPGSADTVNLAYFTESEETDLNYTINYRSLSTLDFSEKESRALTEIDNCRTLSLSIGTENNPVVAYQGGEIRECGSEQQSDAMFSLMEGGSWEEYTGGIGYVERNPVFTDGLAGTTVSVAVDDSGSIHMCYQFFYEGCDAMNFNFPDLLYVKKDGADVSEESSEESVEGNVYNSNGTASEQNNVGDHAEIVIGTDGNPSIIYYADLSPVMPDDDEKGLRLSRKINDTWEHTFIETGIEVGDISVAIDENGNHHVAYYVESEYTDSLGTHVKCLKYAYQEDGAWKTELVDESSLCGNYCSLSINSEGAVGIAYYAMENHSGSREMNDLKYAQRDGSSWALETVSETGDIGRYNSLWFDSEDNAHICSYSNSTKEIYIFVKD